MGLLAPRPTPNLECQGNLISEFSLLLDGMPAKANELQLPVFEIRVFPLLDGLPAKANELHLPRFGIRVVLLLGYVGPWHFIQHYSVQPPKGALPPSATQGTRLYAVWPQCEVTSVLKEGNCYKREDMLHANGDQRNAVSEFV